MISVGKPHETLTVVDAVTIVVGMVVGVGIFKTPSIVAASADSEAMLMLFWVLGGVASFVGAMCYAELTSTYPHTGGDYHYLQKSFGRLPSFLYAWGRMAVIQTGSIAMVAFLIGDYASEISNLGTYSTSIYAALTIVLLTAINIAGISHAKWTQKVLIAAIMLGLFIIAIIGIFVAEPQAAANSGKIIPGKVALGTAMIFVLLTYSGWNEAAFISAEVHAARRNMVRVLLYSIIIITLIYLLINMALLNSLGLTGMAQSEAVMADLMRGTFGDRGVTFISLLILLAALSTINAAIITGARSNYALGQDYPFLSFLGRWQGIRNTPVNALILQAAIALFLVILGTQTRDGFMMMVEYTAPVFWLFLLMVGISIFILRYKHPDTERSFAVPLYPVLPFFFCIICAFMLYSSIMYTSSGSLVGVGVLLSGIPIMVLQKRNGVKR